MIKDLIEIKQLPIIEEQLKIVSKEIDEKVKNVTGLVCTEETVKAVKELRASLNKDFKEFETKRKDVKEKVLAPYMQFENVYKEYISDKFKSADIELKSKIDSVENELKAKKEQEVKEYFEEYKIANEIDFVQYEQAKINVTLSASMKSLKEQVTVFIDRIVDDLNLIETQERRTEILVEYKRNLNASYSIQSIKNKYTQIDLEKKKQEEFMKQANKAVIIPNKEKQEILQAPTKEQKEEVLTVNFKATATRALLKELKNSMEERGIKYE